MSSVLYLLRVSLHYVLKLSRPCMLRLFSDNRLYLNPRGRLTHLDSVVLGLLCYISYYIFFLFASCHPELVPSSLTIRVLNCLVVACFLSLCHQVCLSSYHCQPVCQVLRWPEGRSCSLHLRQLEFFADRCDEALHREACTRTEATIWDSHSS